MYNLISSKALLILAAGLSVCCSAPAQVPPQNNVPIGQPVPPPVLSPNDLPQLADLPAGLKKNYIRTYVPQLEHTDPAMVSFPNYGVSNRMIVATQYYDGLGRQLQDVQRSTNNSHGLDQITPHVYDGLGREAVAYLPYQHHNLGSWGRLDEAPATGLLSFYSNNFVGQHPFGRTVYENSPLSREVTRLAPGNSWVGTGIGISTTLRKNELAENIRVWTIGNASGNLPVTSAAYPARELEVKKVVDEDNHISLTYTNKLGQVILVKNKKDNTTTDDHASYACTYYVYNDLGQLRYVLSPEAVAAIDGTWNLSGQEELCFRYFYDERGRMIEKKVPGKAVDYMVYDYRDRMVLSQDGNLRANGDKWAYTVYDGLDRPMFTGIFTNNNPLTLPASYSRQQLAAQVAAPPPFVLTGLEYSVFYGLTVANVFDWHPAALNDAEIMVHYFYNDYSHAPLNMDLFNASLNPDLPNVTNPAGLQPTDRTHGLLTGMKVKVMDGAVNQPPQQNVTWLSTVNFYNGKGQLLQLQSQNYNGGIDYTNNCYDLQGTLVGSALLHNNPALMNTSQAAYSTTKVVRRYTKNYFTGAITKLEQRINGGGWRAIYANSYNVTDRVSNKLLGGAADNQYTYNIRGWLTGINENSLDALNTPTMFFKEKISYNTGFTNHFYSGNIAGIQWRGAGSNAPKRFYGYGYDRLSRLEHAEFGEAVVGSAPFTWSKATTDFTASDISYDNNGNLQSMRQMGPGQSGPVLMDDLGYHYTAASNRLLSVDDPVNAALQPNTPDFRDGNTGSNDYDYDANGNLTMDKNKAITSVSYNLQNKPEIVTVDGQGTITYLYDALGNRLRKTVHSTATSTPDVVTDYIGVFVYEDNKLKHFFHEEGRCRPVPQVHPGYPASFMYDYFIKDHLGNVRSTIRTDAYSIGDWISEAPQHYNTGLEIASANLEAMTWSHLGHVRNTKPGSGTSTDTKAADLDGDDPDRRVATALMLLVMPGDRFELKAESYRDAELGVGSLGTDGDGIMNALLNGLLDGAAGGENGGGEEGGMNNTQLLNHAFSGDIAQQWEALSGDPLQQDSLAPQSHLNYIVLDENMHVVGSQSGVMQAGAPGQWENVAMNGPMEIGQAGYLLVFTSNKTSGSVFWDNVDLTFYRGQLLEENHYYPFGLTLATTSANPAEENRMKLTTKELQSELGVNWYDFGARMMDEQIGRWTGVDPLASGMASWSPYNYVYNNPVSHTDPTGESPDTYVYNNQTGNYLGTIADNMTDAVAVIDVTAAEELTTRAHISSLRSSNSIYRNIEAFSYRAVAMNSNITGTGVYDIDNCKEWYDSHKNTVVADQLFGQQVSDGGTFFYNGKPTVPMAEISGNVIAPNGKLIVGTRDNETSRAVFASPGYGGIPSEPYKVEGAEIHLHTVSKSFGGSISFEYADQQGKRMSIGSGFASPGLYNSDRNTAKATKYRSVMVDDDGAYLYHIGNIDIFVPWKR